VLNIRLGPPSCVQWGFSIQRLAVRDDGQVVGEY